MDIALTVLAALSTLLWLGFVLLPWGVWRNREVLDVAVDAIGRDSLADVTVLIPARNEAGTIQQTLRSLAGQSRDLNIVVIDDGSEDGTAERACEIELPEIRVIRSTPLPAGWSGKLWALEQGRRRAATPYVLLLDADIELVPGMVAAIKERMHREGVQLISVMAAPSMSGVWEKLLMPAFVYFFKILYPLRLVNSPNRRVAAAAGGCILMETRWLYRIGGFEPIRSAVIDDCALAGRIKSEGAKIWLGLTRSARSIRGYRRLSDLWDMVARTAFTQLRYSGTLLVLCTSVMILVYAAPVALFVFSEGPARYLSAAALMVMVSSYVPILRFYGRSWLWALCLPLIAGLFLAMTWSSAVRYRRGERARWKGRSYRVESRNLREETLDDKAARKELGIHG